MELAHKLVASPVGTLKLVAGAEALVAVLWQDDNPQRVPLGTTVADDHHRILQQAEAQLHEYFAGQRQEFDLPLAAQGTPFQKGVWDALLTIPYGATRSYGQLAAVLGAPNASRAVGAANGRNPLSIVVPCHRVVGATGRLTGFAGGMAAKAHLLALESDRRSLFT